MSHICAPRKSFHNSTVSPIRIMYSCPVFNCVSCGKHSSATVNQTVFFQEGRFSKCIFVPFHVRRSVQLVLFRLHEQCVVHQCEAKRQLVLKSRHLLPSGFTQHHGSAKYPRVTHSQVAIPTHLKLWLAVASHSFKCVGIVPCSHLLRHRSRINIWLKPLGPPLFRK